MQQILLISDYRKNERAGKILYTSYENSSDITAYWYANHRGFDNAQIRNHYAKNTLFDPLRMAGEITVADGYLAHVAVELDYRRCGIGLKLIQLAKKHAELAHIACVQESACYDYCLSTEGEQLVAAGVKKGMIDRSMCDFNSTVGADDPGLMSLHVMRTLNNKENQCPNKIPTKEKSAKRQALAPVSGAKKTCSSQGLVTLDRFFGVKVLLQRSLSVPEFSVELVVENPLKRSFNGCNILN